MINITKFLNALRAINVNFITGVPDTFLNDFCISLETDWEVDRHVIAANEGNAIAMAVGFYLATGGIPLVYMQNSGLGNSTNPLLSLTNKEVYGIPMVLLIGWRGDPSIIDHPQHKLQGAVCPSFLDVLNIPFRVLEGSDSEALDSASWAVKRALEIGSPTALLVKKGVMAKAEKPGFPTDGSTLLSRECAISCVLDSLPGGTIYVASTGRATRELHQLRILRNEAHTHDFLNVGAMGHASSIAIGLALADRNRLVVCLDGDGAALMHLGSFSTAPGLKLSNFLHIVLNNGAHESVGGQPTAGWSVDFTGIAKSVGYKTLNAPVDSKESLVQAIQSLKDGGPSFIDMRIRKGIRSDLPPLKMDPIDLKQKFMSYLSNLLT